MLTNKRAVVILIVVLLVLSSGTKIYQNAAGYVSEPYVRKEIALDTLVEIQAYGTPRSMVESAVDDSFKTIRAIDELANAYDPRSEVSRLTGSAFNRPVEVSIELFEMAKLSDRYFKETNGAFDVTVRPVVLEWDFEEKIAPSKASLDAALEFVGSEKLVLNSDLNTVRFQKNGMAIDLGAVAKGYAADKAIETLKEAGVKSAIVTTGSTTAVLGDKPQPDSLVQQVLRVIGKPKSSAAQKFKIGVQDPRADTGQLLATLNLSNLNISTSGDYQQFFVKNGRRFSHIINPKTGYSDSDLSSVTVVTSRSDAEADILSTALFVMGTDRAREFLNENPDVHAILVTTDGEVSASKDLKKALENAPKKITFF